MNLYDTVQYLCRQNRISVAQLEKQLGLGNGTIGRWSKASPTVENAEKVARFFEISLDTLTGESTANENALVLTPVESDLIRKWRIANEWDREIIDFILSRYGSYADEPGFFDNINERA